ncbi:hypothetical protein [Pseudomonas sp. NA-150]|uniref:hypothetical protein n=1 Tax=Pseudomonas sp. NA-150 TaxID=3367525 RepID=UPI0037C6DE12
MEKVIEDMNKALDLLQQVDAILDQYPEDRQLQAARIPAATTAGAIKKHIRIEQGEDAYGSAMQ